MESDQNEPMRFAHTSCPKCSGNVIIVDGELDWQYVCFGIKGKPCGTAFEIRKSDDVDE